MSASGNFPLPLSADPPTASAGVATANIVYDEETEGYTLTVNDRSQTFLPADIDTGQSNATVTVYLRTAGSTTDSLTLTKAGTSGPLTYQYVGSAFWQRTISGPTSITGTVDALVYGALTAANAVPRTGQANYELGLLGAFARSGGITSVAGDGAMQVDFASGRLAADVRLGDTGVGSWQGTGTVTSTGNGFSGNFASFISDRQYAGQFAGHFFGPNTEEAGAAFHGHSANDGSVFVGTIMGRKTDLGGNASFDTLSKPEFFSIGTNRIAFDSTGENSAPANVSAGESALVIGYDPEPTPLDNILNFFLPENVFRRRTSPGQSGISGGGYAGLDPLLKTSSGWLQYNIPAPLKYMAAGRFVTVNGSRYIFDDFVFGFQTSRSALVAGMAGYQLNLGGTLINSTESPRSLTGQGWLAIDFATGQLSATGDVLNLDNSSDIYGIFNASGQLAASSSNFAGHFGVTGPTNYTGAWNGGFFGPAGEEVGARFGASAANGSVMSGTLYGKRDDSVIAGTTPLADVTERTALLGKVGFVETIDGSPPPPYIYGETVRGIDVTYDPASGDYIFKSLDPGLIGSVDTAFAGSELVPEDSNSDFAAYRSADGQREARILRFSGSGRQLQLTYSSFASVMLKHSDGHGGTLTNRYFIPFGSVTPLAQMPRTGSASYSGLAFGKGNVSGIGELADISGTIRSSVDFSTFNMETLVNLLATDPSGIAANRQLGEYLMTSFVSGNAFAGGRQNTEYSYMIKGLFYGPGAAELGGTFTLSKDGPQGQVRGDFDISGGFVGKKD